MFLGIGIFAFAGVAVLSGVLVWMSRGRRQMNE
jgi:hypothetical protein